MISGATGTTPRISPPKRTHPQLPVNHEANGSIQILGKDMVLHRGPTNIQPPSPEEIQEMEKQDFIRKNRFTSA